MKNMRRFMLEVICSLLVVAIGLGVIFCFMTGSTEHFMPFMKVSSIIIAMNCLGVSLLNKA